MSGMGTDPVSLLSGALSIYSPTNRERPLARYLCLQMKAMGYSGVRIDQGGNAIGEIGEGRVRVLLCGHMDTVPGKLPVKLQGGLLYGRGASDAKSPLCAMLVAGSRAAEAGASITFAAVTREEGDGLGIRTLIENPGNYDFAVFGEPSGARRVTVGYRGRIGVRVKLRTAGGHAGSPWAHDSALDGFFRLLAGLREYQSQHTIKGDHFRSLSLSPTLLSAGTFHNVIPSVCDATLDIRVPPGMDCASVRASVRQIVEALEQPGRAAGIEFDDSTEPYEVNPGSTLVRAFQRAIILKTGGRPILVRKTGTGDMNTYASAGQSECVTYGPGDSNLSHTDGEVVSVDDYLESIGVLSEAIRQVSVLRRG